MILIHTNLRSHDKIVLNETKCFFWLYPHLELQALEIPGGRGGEKLLVFTKTLFLVTRWQLCIPSFPWKGWRQWSPVTASSGPIIWSVHPWRILSSECKRAATFLLTLIRHRSCILGKEGTFSWGHHDSREALSGRDRRSHPLWPQGTLFVLNLWVLAFIPKESNPKTDYLVAIPRVLQVTFSMDRL